MAFLQFAQITCGSRFRVAPRRIPTPCFGMRIETINPHSEGLDFNYGAISPSKRISAKSRYGFGGPSRAPNFQCCVAPAVAGLSLPARRAPLGLGDDGADGIQAQVGFLGDLAQRHGRLNTLPTPSRRGTSAGRSPPVPPKCGVSSRPQRDHAGHGERSCGLEKRLSAQ
jgi:hypothetical protein